MALLAVKVCGFDKNYTKECPRLGFSFIVHICNCVGIHICGINPYIVISADIILYFHASHVILLQKNLINEGKILQQQQRVILEEQLLCHN